MTWRSSLLHIPHQFHPMPAHLLWNWSGFSIKSTPQASSLKCVWNWWHHGIPNINLRTWQINCSVCHLERLLVLMHLHILAVSHHRFMNKGYRERHLLQPSRHKFLNPSLFMFVQCYVSYTVFKFSTLLKNWPSSLLLSFAPLFGTASDSICCCASSFFPTAWEAYAWVNGSVNVKKLLQMSVTFSIYTAF